MALRAAARGEICILVRMRGEADGHGCAETKSRNYRRNPARFH
jgi:hypothetical protein